MNDSVHKRPIYAARWRNFRALLADRGTGITAVADALGKTQGQVSHFGGETPTKVIGDQIATEIEVAFGLPEGALDSHNSGEGTVDKPIVGVRPASHFAIPDDGILTQAEDWVAFEERSRGKAFRYPPVRRLRRLLEIVKPLVENGGNLSAEVYAEIVRAADAAKGEGSERTAKEGEHT